MDHMQTTQLTGGPLTTSRSQSTSPNGKQYSSLNNDGSQGLAASVLVVSYNDYRRLSACLTAVLALDFPRERYEVIVVDNASRDGSPDLVERNFPGVRVIRLDRNVGPGEAINRVRPQLRGRYMAYLNQDAVPDRHWLTELVDVIKAHPYAGVVESNMILPSWPEYRHLKDGGMVEQAYVCDLNPWGVHDFRAMPITTDTPPIPVLGAYCAGCIVDPKILDQMGYWFDPDFLAYFDDIDLGLRLNEMGFQVLLAPRSVVYHDTEWAMKLNVRSIRRAYLCTRNMFLGFYKTSYASEYLRLLPALVTGKLVRAGQYQHSGAAKVAYAVAGTPLLLVAAGAALVKLPAFRERRKMTLSRRRAPKGWLVDSVRKSCCQMYQPPQTLVREPVAE